MPDCGSIRFYPRFVIFDEGRPAERRTEGRRRVYLVSGREVARETLDLNGNSVRLDGAIPDGAVREFYPTGELRFEFRYKNNLLDGISREFLKNGAIGCETSWLGGKMHGARKVFTSGDEGTIMEIFHYRLNLLHGAHIIMFENGKPWSEENFEDDLLQGEKKVYYKNGQIKLREYYERGRLSGKRAAFHDNGRVQCEETYIDGVLLSRRVFTRSGAASDNPGNTGRFRQL
ncbi:MAG: hypothetical protein PHP45_01605 [Elusimicrobiales bacterium]|nr:hypothetical protein [Elusimicrobiales bacterium]